MGFSLEQHLCGHYVEVVVSKTYYDLSWKSYILYHMHLIIEHYFPVYMINFPLQASARFADWNETCINSGYFVGKKKFLGIFGFFFGISKLPFTVIDCIYSHSLLLKLFDYLLNCLFSLHLGSLPSIFFLSYMIIFWLPERNALPLSSSVVKTQKVAVDVHALLESLSLCKLIAFDDPKNSCSNFYLCTDFVYSAVMNYMILVYQP